MFIAPFGRTDCSCPIPVRRRVRRGSLPGTRKISGGFHRFGTAFVRELNASTNVLLQLEAKALDFADANDDQKLALTFTNFFDALFANRELLLANPVEQFYLDWGVDDLVGTKTSGISTATKESLQHLFYSDYWPRLQAMDQEYWSKTVPANKFFSAFQQQKQYLQENKP